VGKGERGGRKGGEGKACRNSETLSLLVFTRPPCTLNLKNQKKKKKNEAFLPSEKEENQTLVRALISFQMHTISQAISHSTTGESNSAIGKKNSRFIA
jgi:hypothetical protein